MSVGTISSFDNLQTSHGISGVLHKASALVGAEDFIANINRSKNIPYTFGTGAGKINQVVEIIFTVVKNTTTVLDLSGVVTNRVGDLLSTFTVVKFLKVEYLTVAQDATSGTASTATVTIKPGGSNPVTTSPLGAAEQFTLKPGAVLIWEDALTGFTVTAATADTLDFVHSDNVLDAALRLTIFGEK